MRSGYVAVLLAAAPKAYLAVLSAKVELAVAPVPLIEGPPLPPRLGLEPSLLALSFYILHFKLFALNAKAFNFI